MGWCSGTRVFDDMCRVLLGKQKLKPETVLSRLIDTLEDMDWDCQSDSEFYEHPAVRKVFKRKHPEYFEDEHGI